MLSIVLPVGIPVASNMAEIMQLYPIQNTLSTHSLPVGSWRSNRITVLIDQGKDLRGWSDTYIDAVRDAISSWSSMFERYSSWGDEGGFERLTFIVYIQGVNASEKDDYNVKISWRQRLDMGKYMGLTCTMVGSDGYLRHASITLGIAKDDNGYIFLKESEMRNIALHEFGHALGLGHSSDKNDAMYPVFDSLERYRTPTRTDIMRLAELYR